MKKKRIFLFLIAALHCALPTNILSALRLSTYGYGSASVLPICKHHSAKCIILGREAFGKSRGSYDDFGGGRDKGENHPVITAAREFFEEAILALSIKLSLAETQNYIDIAKTSHTINIIVHARNVTYIINFNRYKKLFLKNFYKARKQTNNPLWREKDRIALVKWDMLKKTINDNSNNSGLQIEAWEVDPITQLLNKKIIILRSSFVKKLRSFFMDKQYRQGLDKKIRFYN